MKKQVTALALGLAALVAIALPATAGASKVTVDEAGTTLVSTGTGLAFLSGTSHFEESLMFETELGQIGCEEIRFEGELGKNTGTEVLFEGLSGASSGCSVEGESVTLSGFAIQKLQSSVSGQGIIKFIVTVSFFNDALTCTWSGEGVVTYATGDVLVLSDTVLNPSRQICGQAIGTGRLTNTDLLSTPVYWH